MMIPIGLAITQSQPQLTMPILAACMAGGVYGDHCSPISDTTIMASAGAACNHLSHVSPQLPYATTVAAVSALCFVISGFTGSAFIPLIIGAVLMVGILAFLKNRQSSYRISDEANKNSSAAM